MYNKKGIIFLLFFSILFAIIIIGALLYLKIRFGGLEFKTGNIVVNIDYEKEENLENDRLSEISYNISNISINQNISIRDHNITLN